MKANRAIRRNNSLVGNPPVLSTDISISVDIIAEQDKSSAPVHGSGTDMSLSLASTSMFFSDSSLDKGNIDADNSFSHKRKQDSEISKGNLILI